MERFIRNIIPRRLKQLRIFHDLTQLGLAERSGVSKSSISKLESGLATDARISTLCQLSGALYVLPGYLLGISDPDLHRLSVGPMSIQRLGQIYQKDRDLLACTTVCPICEYTAPPGERHLINECLRVLHDRGYQPPYLSSMFAISTQAINAILDAEYKRLARFR